MSFIDVRKKWTTKDLGQIGHSAWHFRRKVAPNHQDKIEQNTFCLKIGQYGNQKMLNFTPILNPKKNTEHSNQTLFLKNWLFCQFFPFLFYIDHLFYGRGYPVRYIQYRGLVETSKYLEPWPVVKEKTNQRPYFQTFPRYAMRPMTPKRESKRQWFMSNYLQMIAQ